MIICAGCGVYFKPDDIRSCPKCDGELCPECYDKHVPKCIAGEDNFDDED